MRVKDYYQSIIRNIMSERGLEPLKLSPTPIVPAKAGFEEILLHTDWYVKTGDTRPHYRYRRYIEMLRLLNVPDKRVAHVDIGCGAGLFSWALLDWATDNSVRHDRVNLYGFDHCRAMINLAGIVREKLTLYIANYPDLRYFDDLESLLRGLEDNHGESMNYIITFGHVLAQTYTHSPADIDNFARIIVRIRELMNAEFACPLIAVDAGHAAVEFAKGWESLLQSLDRNRIRYDQQDVPVSPINDSKRAKWAMLNHT